MKAPSTMEAITSAKKKKKMKQARLPFQALSASKSSSDTNNAPNKKRKLTLPLEGCTKSKVRKCRKKSSCMSICKGKDEDVEEEHGVEEIEISDEEKEDSDCKNKTVDITPGSSSEKNKKVDKLHEKPGALTKFLKKADNEVSHGLGRDSNVCESRDEPNCSNKFVHNEEDDISNKSSDAHSVEFTLQRVSRVNENLENDNVTSKNTRSYSSCQGSDSDIAILSSDNEMSDLNKSVTSGNEETTSKSASSPTTSPAFALRDDKNIKEKKLTQKQLAKRQEIAKRKEEKKKLKMEREKKREEEKANRRKKKEEKQREKEEKERIEKEQKKKEKELKEFKKQMEIEQKQKEKEAKEEERRRREEAKEEEKRRKEEEKLEAERKKQKAASNFASFFVSKKQEVKSVEEVSIIEPKNFMPFEVKSDMKIAPVRRRILTKHEKSLLDEKCNVDMTKSELYLENMRKQKIVLRTSSKTWPLETKDDDIILLDADEDNDGCSNIITDTHNLEKHRPKLLQFGDNRRPPYWGTWRKRSNIINPRQPFVKDKKWFDYEIDSDDEWEEEEPGESLKGSDDEKDEENPEENEYDVDNEFMVPHGYLSDEEARADEEEMEDMSPQTQKMKLKLLGEQFEAERNTKTDKLKPKIIGCIWQGFRSTFPEFVPTKVLEFLSMRQAWVSHLPIVLPSSETSQNDTASNIECKAPTQQSGRNTKKTKVPHEALPDLIRLVHGNTHGRHFLLKEFMTFWSKNDKAGERQLSKVSVSQKIKELANWMACPEEEGPMHLKKCWYVSKNIRKQYLPNEDLTLPNRWTYILIPRRKTDTQDVTDKTEKEEKEKEKRHVPLITQFTKKITQEELKKQLAMKPDQVSAVAPKLPSPLQRPPKRVPLISVSRGESFPERSRENALAKL